MMELRVQEEGTSDLQISQQAHGSMSHSWSLGHLKRRGQPELAQNVIEGICVPVETLWVGVTFLE
jgi:hypothetical protein